MDLCRGEASKYCSTPVSSRSVSKTLSLHESDTLSPNSTNTSNDADSSFNVQFASNYRHSCPGKLLLNNEPGTPKVKRKYTPSSVRFRSRMSTAKGTTKNYTSPKKRLNFDG